MNVRLNKLILAGLVAGWLAPWLVVAHLASRPRERAASGGIGRAVRAVPPHERVSGPWGVLNLEPIVLELPPSRGAVALDLQPYRRWVFRDSAPGDIRQRLAKAGVSRGDGERLLQTAEADAAVNGFALHPPDDVVRALSPGVRAALYADLGQSPDNPAQAKPFLFRGASVQEWFARSGVPNDIVEKIEPLVYRREGYLLFADLQLVVPGMTSGSDRVNLYRALHRTATLRVRISLNPGDDSQKVVDYWGHPDRCSAIEPLVTALASDPEGLNIVTFLPPFARTRLYTYLPSPYEDSADKRDCLWTSLNFFNDPPDNRVGETIGATLPQAYEPVRVPTQLGDIVLLWHGHTLVHACVYLAGDIVFTKNGLGTGHPFVIEKLADVVACYRVLHGDITLGFCRRKKT